MLVRKILSWKLVCPHCGTEIVLSNDEYKKYCGATEGYGGSTITCQREDEDGKSRDIEYVNMDCPSCKGYIPVTVAGIDVDIWGFCYSKHATPMYDISEEHKMSDYIEDFLGSDVEEES